VQVMMIPIADRHNAYAHQVAQELRAASLRVEVDDSDDRMGAKIRRAQLQRIPYMLVVGDREVRSGTVSLRLRSEEDLGPHTWTDFKARALDVVSTRKGI